MVNLFAPITIYSHKKLENIRIQLINLHVFRLSRDIYNDSVWLLSVECIIVDVLCSVIVWFKCKFSNHRSTSFFIMSNEKLMSDNSFRELNNSQLIIQINFVRNSLLKWEYSYCRRRFFFSVCYLLSNKIRECVRMVIYDK